MKKLCSVCIKAVCRVVVILFIFAVGALFSACTDNNTYDGELLRLHIRANSNADIDQSVKLKVRDAVNAFIADNIDKTTFDEAYADIGARLDELVAVAGDVLKAQGFTYGARAKLTNEYFPTRAYNSVTLPEGYYDALVIELGEGSGDNWWCVVYPPLCYGSEFKYKSYFAELFGAYD